METLRIFDVNFQSMIQNGVHCVSSVDNKNLDVMDQDLNIDGIKEMKIDDASNKNVGLSCSFCQIEFVDANQQREHYKLDWHRYNLKQSLLGKKFMSEEDFVEKSVDDISSISGSDSDDANSNQGQICQNTQNKTILQVQQDGGNSKYFSIHSCLLHDKKEEIDNDLLIERLIICSKLDSKWTILMLGGGHFAGAIFEAESAILHKTFHCYTVRAGQGGTQSSRDNKSAFAQPKSAGASLRRYNEQSLIQHVKSILENWRKDINESCLIIYRAAGPYNRNVLFGGNSAILDKSDKRLRTIPFTTRRPTFAEVKRVYSVLTTCQIFNSHDSLSGYLNKMDCSKKSGKPEINRAKSRERPDRPIPIDPISSDSPDESNLISENLEINLDDNLTIFDNTPIPKLDRGMSKKLKKSKSEKLNEKIEQRKKALIDILVKGNLNDLEKRIENDDFKIDEILDKNLNTALHLAAMNEHCNLIQFLLDKNADVCLKNDKNQTPYASTQNREIREIFKTFARENPNKFNYNKAQIPISSLTQKELSEKRKIQRKIKKEKDKVKKIELDAKKREDLEKARFLNLTDREKRALAAERRILNQNGSIIVRCFLCALDITGKVPFEYLGNRFCTIDCLKAHRMQNPVVLS